MRYQIWQIDYDWKEKHPDERHHPWRFEDWGWAKANGFTADDYVMMYQGEIAGNNPSSVLEQIFIIHNRDDRPAGDRMYSLSMSDIVAFPEYGTAYYVDMVGFKDVTEYFSGKIARKRVARVKFASDDEICLYNLCPSCGEVTSICIDYEEYEGYERWAAGGGYIQDLLPTLSPSEREFLISGLCFDCQKRIFGSRKAGLGIEPRRAVRALGNGKVGKVMKKRVMRKYSDWRKCTGSKSAKKRASVDWDAYDAEEFVRADDLYLPAYGEGETMATQIVTAVAKLVHEWYNNGGVYDKCETCNDVSSYANWLYKYAAEFNVAIADALEWGADAIGDKWFGDINESAYEDALYALAVAAEEDGDWLRAMNGIPARGTVYRCDGPFEYTVFDDEEEDDDWRW